MEISDHIAQIAAALVFIVALVVGLGWLVKRLNHGSFSGSSEIQVVASTFLGPKEKVLLLEVKNRQILIGVNSQSISALSEFELSDSDDQSSSFATVLTEAKS